MNAVAAVLFDRDGTLVEDVPYNGAPERVRPLAGAREAVALVRAAGLRTAVVTNQSGIGRGLVTAEEVRRVNDRIDQLFGAFDMWAVCPHVPQAGCTCRKPRPGLLLEAAARLGVAPQSCVLIGDIGADVEAARAAGAHGVLVPDEATRREEIEAAEHAFPDLLSAVRALCDGNDGKRSR